MAWGCWDCDGGAGGSPAAPLSPEAPLMAASCPSALLPACPPGPSREGPAGRGAAAAPAQHPFVPGNKPHRLLEGPSPLLSSSSLSRDGAGGGTGRGVPGVRVGQSQRGARSQNHFAGDEIPVRNGAGIPVAGVTF